MYRVVALVLMVLVQYDTAHDQEAVCPPVAGKPKCVCAAAGGTIDLTKLAKMDGTPM